MTPSAVTLLVLTTVMFTLAASVTGQRPGELTWPVAQSLPSFSLKNNSGVWFSDEEQYAKAEWDAYDVENTLPNCIGASKGLFTYKHSTHLDPAYMSLSVNDTTGKGSIVLAHHHDTFTWDIVSARDHILTYANPSWDSTDSGCTHWKPYIDLSSGKVKAQSISKTEWVKDSNGKVTTNTLTCFVKDFETAGCYPQGPNKVHTVSVATWTCVNGACSSFAPVVKDNLPEEDE